MTIQNNVSAWIERAEEDYTLARTSLQRKKPLLNGAVFHAQQCVEKYLKALLVFHQLPFPKTHDLAALGDLCLQIGVIVPINEDSLQRLSAYAVEARYPGEQPSMEDAKDAIETVKSVRGFVRKYLRQHKYRLL
ncbi:MAG: HEPN domain-containing protein [Chloroflexota bacterium]|jgi:HEPN domain-containing protein